MRLRGHAAGPQWGVREDVCIHTTCMHDPIAARICRGGGGGAGCGLRRGADSHTHQPGRAWGPRVNGGGGGRDPRGTTQKGLRRKLELHGSIVVDRDTAWTCTGALQKYKGTL